MSTKIRPITHIITGSGPVNPWPPTGSYLLCARLYTNTFLDHITLNTVSWNYDGGSSPTYSDANCTQVLSDLSSWNDSSPNTVLQTTGQNEYGTYVDIFTDNSRSSESAVDFCVILGNDRRQTITDDSWKITRVEVYKVGMTNGIYRVNNNPSKGQWFRNRNEWTEFPITPQASTIFRPISIFENITEPTLSVVLMPDGKYWTDTNLAIDDGLGGISVVNSNTYISDYNLNQMGNQYFYDYDAAMRVSSSISGFHLPSQPEMFNLISACYSEHPDDFTYALRTSYNWYDSNGTNLYDFKLFGTGGYTQSSIFLGAGQHAYLWTSNSYGTVANIDIDNPNSINLESVSLAFGPKYSIRLIKD